MKIGEYAGSKYVIMKGKYFIEAILAVNEILEMVGEEATDLYVRDIILSETPEGVQRVSVQQKC